MAAKQTAKQAVALLVATVSLLVLPLTIASASTQEDSNSVNWILPGCRASGNNGPLPDHLAYKAGACLGMIKALGYASPSVCTPRGVNPGQMRAVVMQYLDQRPNRWHESFLTLADEALTKTWPCRS
jgi:hypothetical protein